MTTPADDPAVEEAFESYLAGRSVPAGEVRLVSFADAVRASATEPGRPNAVLAELLATGLLQDQTGPAARPARRPRRRRTRVLASALFAKIASAGLAAKAATAVGVTVVGLTTAGFTGNLGPVQHGFATLVDHATPFTAPDQAPASEPQPSTDGDTVPTPAETSPSGTPSPDAVTGTGISDDAGRPAHPSNYGGQVSDWAHQKNSDRKSGATTVPAKPTKAGHPSAGHPSAGTTDDGSGQDAGTDSSHGPRD
jgi:hypothetical protein